MKRFQSGITLIGLLFWAVVVASGGIVLMKVIPAITEYQTIKKMVNVASKDATTVAEIRESFEKAKLVEYNTDAVSAQDLDITKENDKIVVRFAYDKEISLVDPVYLLIKFKGQSK